MPKYTRISLYKSFDTARNILREAIKKFCNLAIESYHIISHMLSFFVIFSCKINVYFQLLFLAVYALKQNFLSINGFHEDGTSNFLLVNNYWEPSLDYRQDGLVEQTHSCRELAEQPMTCASVHCHEKVKLPSDNFRHCFCLMTSSK